MGEPVDVGMHLLCEVVRARLTLNLSTCTNGGQPYAGTVTYSLRITDPSSMDTGLPIHTAGPVVVTSLRAMQGKRSLKLRGITPTICFQEGSDLRVGDVDVCMGFSSCVNREDEEAIGLYACGVPTPGVLCTFFEVSHARRCFPCADDPAVRVPWSMSVELGTLAGRTMVSNMAPTSEGKVWEFPETPPMPTYLLGFVVSPQGFVVTPGERCSVAVPRGFPYNHAAKIAAWVTQAVGLCEEYFSAPLDIDTLRVVIVPRLGIGGGMEHHGLITLNGKKGDVRSDSIESLCELTVHEVVHHWIGNMVGFPFTVKEGLAQYFEVRMADTILGRPPTKVKKGLHRPTNNGVVPEKVFTGQVYTRSLNEITALAETLGEEGLRSMLLAIMGQHQYQLLDQTQCDQYFRFYKGEK